MANDMFDELRSIKTKLKSEEKRVEAKKDEVLKEKREGDMKEMFNTYMKDVKVKK